MSLIITSRISRDVARSNARGLSHSRERGPVLPRAAPRPRRVLSRIRIPRLSFAGNRISSRRSRTPRGKRRPPLVKGTTKKRSRLSARVDAGASTYRSSGSSPSLAGDHARRARPFAPSRGAARRLGARSRPDLVQGEETVYGRGLFFPNPRKRKIARATRPQTRPPPLL